jgi:hypothetical protein
MEAHRRFARRTCLLLLVGAIINIAVAWSCSLAADPHGPATFVSSMQVQSSTIVKTRRCSFGCETTIFERTRVGGAGPRTQRSALPFTVDRKRWTIEQSGWPMYCLSGGRRVIDIPSDEADAPAATAQKQSASAMTESRSRFAVPVQPGQSARGDPWAFRMLPMKPLWLGFCVNTLAFAGVIYILLAIPAAVSRRRRIKRGLCPNCAYPIGDSDVCTECGVAVALKN